MISATAVKHAKSSDPAVASTFCDSEMHCYGTWVRHAGEHVCSGGNEESMVGAAMSVSMWNTLRTTRTRANRGETDAEREAAETMEKVGKALR